MFTYMDGKAEGNLQISEGRCDCPIIYVFHLVSRKWVMDVLCKLNKYQVMRYGEIKKAVPGITNMALTQVLKELAASEVINRIQYNEIPPHTEYSLTEQGKELIRALYSVARWGLKQMNEKGHSTCADKCYSIYYEYIPAEKEKEVFQYPKVYDERYQRYYNEILASGAGECSTEERMEAFLLIMLRVLTEDGKSSTRWAMFFFIREDTENYLQKERPQYQILRELIEEGKAEGKIKAPMETDYILEMISKIITGCVGEWQMEKCVYDVIERNRAMIRWFCRSLFQS